MHFRKSFSKHLGTLLLRKDSGHFVCQVIQGRLSDVLKATGQSNGPVRVNVHVDLGGGAPGPAMGINGMLNPCLGNFQPALQDSRKPKSTEAELKCFMY